MTDHPNYEANPLHYLRRAAEVLGYRNPIASATAAMSMPESNQSIHRTARYISTVEPLPDPEERLKELAREAALEYLGMSPLCRSAKSYLAGFYDDETLVQSALTMARLMQADGWKKEP